MDSFESELGSPNVSTEVGMSNDELQTMVAMLRTSNVDAVLEDLSLTELERLRPIVYEKLLKSSPPTGNLIARTRDMIFRNLFLIGDKRTEEGENLARENGKWTHILGRIDMSYQEKVRLEPLDIDYLRNFLDYVDASGIRYMGTTLEANMIKDRVKMGRRQNEPGDEFPYVVLCRDNSFEENLQFTLGWLEQAKWLYCQTATPKFQKRVAGRR